MRYENKTPQDSDPSVSIVITTYNHSQFIASALSSAISQTSRPHEILVVDDGSTDTTKNIVSEFEQVNYLYQPNQGLSAARNTGLHTVTSEYIVFLDADDILFPRAIKHGIDCVAENPSAAFVSGAYRKMNIDGQLKERAHYQIEPVVDYCTLLTGNHIGMHGAVLFKVDVLRQVGGYDVSLNCCEDYDIYLRISRDHKIACHSNIVAVYRTYIGSMSSNASKMLTTSLRVLERQRRYIEGDVNKLAKYQKGKLFWIEHYGYFVVWQSIRKLVHFKFASSAKKIAMLCKLDLKIGVASMFEVVREIAVLRAKPALIKLFHLNNRKKVKFGHLNRTTPFSTDFGYGKGLPVDRYYIEKFLKQYEQYVNGDVLEVGDSAYSNRYENKKAPANKKVIHLYDKNADYVGELTDSNILPEDKFDCILLTQTLHLIYDFEEAIKNLHKSLKHDGVLLITVPGISQICSDEWSKTWAWSFTTYSLKIALEKYFDANKKESLESYGNVLAATSFLYGLPASQLSETQLSVVDPKYQLVICACYRK